MTESEEDLKSILMKVKDTSLHEARVTTSEQYFPLGRLRWEGTGAQSQGGAGLAAVRALARPQPWKLHPRAHTGGLG